MFRHDIAGKCSFRTRRNCHSTFIIFSLLPSEGGKCVDTAIPSCYFSKAGKFFTRTLLTEARQTGTIPFVAKKTVLTKGVGEHREKLSSFELARRNAGIAACNI